MHQQKMIHGVTGSSKKDRSSSSTTSVNKSSLHGFSIDALAGSSSKRGAVPDGLSSDDDDVASWDEVGDCSEDDDIDIDGEEDIGDNGGHPGTALSTTSDSSRDEVGGRGRSPTSRSHHLTAHHPSIHHHQQPLNHLSTRRHGK